MRPAALAIALSACSLSEPAGDPFPVHVDLDAGAVLVHVERPGDAPIAATLDVLAPFTLIDPGPGPFAVQRSTTELDLLGQRTPGSTDLIERAVFSSDLVLLHPCDPAVASCTVGPPAAPIAIGAVLGADTLGGSAIRFDFPNSDVYVLPDIAGADDLRDQEGDARFPGPFRGGGTLVLGGADVDFSGRRIAIASCFGWSVPKPTDPPGPPTGGTDALLVMSTGLGATLIGATAYARYCQANPTICDGDPTKLPPATALLASGPIAGGLAHITNLALVANPPPSTRGPCRDLFARHCLAGLEDPTCHAKNTDLCKTTTCNAPATVELGPSAVIDVIVIPDDDPTLQALRAELRPDQAEVDGILGVDALRRLVIDVDYPDNRLLARCGAGQSQCKVLPTLGSVPAP